MHMFKVIHQRDDLDSEAFERVKLQEIVKVRENQVKHQQALREAGGEMLMQPQTLWIDDVGFEEVWSIAFESDKNGIQY